MIQIQYSGCIIGLNPYSFIYINTDITTKAEIDGLDISSQCIRGDVDAYGSRHLGQPVDSGTALYRYSGYYLPSPPPNLLLIPPTTPFYFLSTPTL